MHERRQSSQSMQNDMGNQNMSNMSRNFAPPAGRGRGFQPQPPYGPIPSPGLNYRQMAGQPRPPSNVQHFQQGANPQYMQGRNSPALRNAQPHMPPQHNPQMQHYGQHMNPQHQVYSPSPSAILSTSRTASSSSLRLVSSSRDSKDSPLQAQVVATVARSAEARPAVAKVKEPALTDMTLQQMFGHPPFDPYGGGFQPYGYPTFSYQQQYPGQAPPPSPRPSYPGAFNNQTPGMQQPPFAPADMSRSASQSSRPPSSIGQPQTPSLPNHPPPSQTPVQNQQPQQPQSSAFVRPPKTSKAIKIMDASGNEVSISKPASTPSTAQAQPQTPVIVSTPNAPTPPPRAPSNQPDRAESKSAKSAEETKNAFLEQVKRQMEDEKRKKDADATAAAKAEQDEADSKAKAEKDEADSKAKAEKEESDSKAKAEQDKADLKAKADKDEADAKVKAEKDEADAKAKARAEQDAADLESKRREDAEKAAENQLKEATAAAEKAAAVAAKDKEGAEAAEAAERAMAKDEADKAPKEETEDERIEREIAEMEAAEKEEEERERAYTEKRNKEKAEAAKVEAEKAKNADDELKRQEREAEEREEAREREREAEKTAPEEADEDSKSMFDELKRPTVGPGASQPESGADTPIVEEEAQDESADTVAMPPPSQQTSAAPKPLGAQKQRPAQLKLETNKRVEPAEPTPGMQALKSARFLELKEEAKYPDGFKSPNPALNLGGARKGRAYDKDFLLQFQGVFKEKPSVDWDQKIKETLGPGDERPRSGAQTPASAMGPRQTSGRPGGQVSNFSGGAMGTFGGGNVRTLPPNTTSEQRFAMTQMGGQRPNPGMAMPGPMGRMPSQLGMGAPGVGMSRNNSVQHMGGMAGPNSPRQPSARGGRGGSRRGDRVMSKKEESDMMAKMPLTAHMQVAPLEKSTTGWKPPSVGQPIAVGPDLSGNMAPDMVQRKVKAALNKMTPENFDKISDQILEIAAQSKNESDGRTLRQVIALTFEKACDEAHWAGMYAKFCSKMLTGMSQEIRDETIKDKNNNPVIGGALFRKYLLNRCQEEFERGWQANLPDKPEGESKEAVLLSDEYYIAAAAKRRGLGLIQFIGQLYKLRMLTLRIMHECVLRLLNFEGEPDESAVENLTTLLRSVGRTMEDDENGHNLLTTYFDRIDAVLLKSDALASRPRFMIMDLLDMRRAGWKGKGDDSKGPKTLDQIHAEAAAAEAKKEAERQRTSQRGGGGGGRMGQGRGDARNFSGNMAPPVDYSRTTVGMDDLRRLQNRGQSQRQTGGGLGPGGSLGPGSTLGARSGSKRGLGPPSSGNTTRTNTPPVDKEKKEESSAQPNPFR